MDESEMLSSIIRLKMKLLLGIVSVVAAFAVNGQDFHTEADGKDLHSQDGAKIHNSGQKLQKLPVGQELQDSEESDHHIKEKNGDHEQTVRRTIEAKLESVKEELVSVKGGLNASTSNLNSELQSINNNMNKINSSIHSELRSLAVKQECPISRGYFIAPGSDRCLGVFLDKLLTWPEAVAKCKEAGLVLLTKPPNVVALHKYLIDTYYVSTRGQWFWVNAKGDGYKMKWQQHKDSVGISEIENNNPLYVTGTQSGSSVSTSYCLQIATATSYLSSKPGKVYYTVSCNGDKEYALCEKIMD